MGAVLFAGEVLGFWTPTCGSHCPQTLGSPFRGSGQGCLFLIWEDFCLVVFRTQRQLAKSIPLSDPNPFQRLNGSFHLLNQILHFIMCPLKNTPGRKENKETARKPRNYFLPVSFPVQLRKLPVTEERWSAGTGEDLWFSPDKITLNQNSSFSQVRAGDFPSLVVLLSLPASLAAKTGVQAGPGLQPPKAAPLYPAWRLQTLPRTSSCSPHPWPTRHSPACSDCCFPTHRKGIERDAPQSGEESPVSCSSTLSFLFGSSARTGFTLNR